MIDELEQTYTLNCDACGDAFYSKEAFPKPQLCPKCRMTNKQDKEFEKLLLETLCEFCFPYVCSHWDLPALDRPQKCKPLADALTKAKAYYEPLIQEAVKAERERVLRIVNSPYGDDSHIVTNSLLLFRQHILSRIASPIRGGN